MPPRPVKTEPVRRSGNYRLGPHLAVQIPYDGVCACALAFSTLLSSQGADAHRLEPCNSIRGNPANLPASHKTVKAVSRFRFGCLLRVNQLNPTVVSRYRSLRTKGKRSAGGLMRPWPAGHPVSHRAVLKTREAGYPCQIGTHGRRTGRADTRFTALRQLCNCHASPLLVPTIGITPDPPVAFPAGAKFFRQRRRGLSTLAKAMRGSDLRRALWA